MSLKARTVSMCLLKTIMLPVENQEQDMDLGTTLSQSDVRQVSSRNCMHIKSH